MNAIIQQQLQNTCYTLGQIQFEWRHEYQGPFLLHNTKIENLDSILANGLLLIYAQNERYIFTYKPDADGKWGLSLGEQLVIICKDVSNQTSNNNVYRIDRDILPNEIIGYMIVNRN